MTLIEAVRDLGSFDRERTIYAALPWSMNSLVIVEYEPLSGGLPKEAEELGLKYFIEVFIAFDFLEDWVKSCDATPSLKEKCDRLIQYAINDA